MAQSQSQTGVANSSGASGEKTAWARAEEIMAAGRQRYMEMERRVPVLDKTLGALSSDFSLWATKMARTFEQHGARANEICASASEEERVMEGMLSELASVHNSNDIEMKQFAASVHYKQETISILQEKATKKTCEMRELDNTIASQREKCAQRRRQLEQMERRQKRTEAELADTYRSYRKAFGVHVKTSDSNVLSFTFSDIDANAAEKGYLVEVEALDTNYKAKRCVPMITDFDKLATRLELGNLESLSQFLRDVRQGFVLLSKQQQ